jgi:hypothetical protein
MPSWRGSSQAMNRDLPKTTFKGASTNGNRGGTGALHLKGSILKGIKMMYPIICKIQIS